MKTGMALMLALLTALAFPCGVLAEAAPAQEAPSKILIAYFTWADNTVVGPPSTAPLGTTTTWATQTAA